MDNISKNCTNFEDICRTCMGIEGPKESIEHYINLIVVCASVQVSLNDGLPQNICSICIQSLQEAHKLRNKIEESNSILKSYMLTNTIKSDNETNTSGSKDQMVLTVQNVVDYDETKYTPLHTRQSPDILLLKKEVSVETELKATCHTCNKTFSCKAQLTRHIKRHSVIKSYICEQCGNSYKESGALRKHIMAKHTTQNKPYKCTECNKSFDLRSTLVRHNRTHTKEKPFGCEICGKFYPSKSYLNHHKKIHLERKRAFVCNICEKSFLTKEALKAHLNTHSSETPYHCNLCDASFSVNGSLKSHMKYVHIKEKNYMCHVCANLFTTKKDLDEHIKRHSGEKGKTIYQCNLCDKHLSSSSHLSFHIKSEHTGERSYVCEFCSKSFVTSNALKVHRRYHTGERLYKCLHCHKAFVTNENRKIHERIHNGQRPYQCITCGATFIQSSTLKTHIKTHHAIKIN